MNGGISPPTEELSVTRRTHFLCILHCHIAVSSLLFQWEDDMLPYIYMNARYMIWLFCIKTEWLLSIPRYFSNNKNSTDSKKVLASKSQ